MKPVTTFFEEKLAQYGDDPRSLDWSSKESQYKRFEVLARPLHNLRPTFSVLDVGCGLGHLHDFLKLGFREQIYTGIDTSPKMIEAARARVPEQPELFRVGAVDAEPPASVDFVVASGVLNIEQGDNESAMRDLIGACYKACVWGCAINMLSEGARTHREGRHYYMPEWIIDDVLILAEPWGWAINHSYMPHDFTLFLFKQAPRLGSMWLV